MKKHKVIYQGMSQDMSPTLQDAKKYYSAQDIDIYVDDSSAMFSVHGEKGNTLSWTVPDVTNTAGTFQVSLNGNLRSTVSHNNLSSPSATSPSIVGHCNLRDQIVIFSTADGEYVQIWLLTIGNTITEELVYYNKLDISLDNPIRKAIGRYENSITKKVFFTDNNNYLRYINVADSNSINIPPALLDITPSITLSQPFLESTTSGQFTSGKVAYAYSLVDNKGGVSAISAISDLYNVNDGISGGALDEELGIGFVIKIPFVDTNYQTLRVYRLKYTSLNQEPTISLITEQTIDGSSATIVDDGLTNISNTSVEELLFLGSQVFKAKDLAVKDNRLFAANITYSNFDVDDWDARAYRFDTTPEALIQDNSQGDLTLTSPSDTVPETYDCICPTNIEHATLTNLSGNTTQNPNYMKYVYQFDGVTLGAEGPNIKVKITSSTDVIDPDTTGSWGVKKTRSTFDRATETKTYKRDEIYRFGIVFYNTKGQRSPVKWICDLRMPNQDDFPITDIINDTTVRNNLDVEFSLKSVPNDVAGWQIVRAERTKDDKTIMAQGVVTGTILTSDSTYSQRPDYFIRTWHNQSYSRANRKEYTFNEGTSIDATTGSVSPSMNLCSSTLIFYSPEVEFDSGFGGSGSVSFNVVGGLQINNGTSVSKATFYDYDGDGFTNKGPSLSLPFENTVSSGTKGYQVFIKKAAKLYCDDIVYIPILGTTTVLDENTTAPFYLDSGYGTQKIYNFHSHETTSSLDITQFSMYYGKGLGARIGFYGQSNALEDRIGSAIPKDQYDKVVLVDYRRELSNQYGGNSYEAIQRTNYIAASDYKNINTLSSIAYRGDTYIQYYSFLRSQIPDVLGTEFGAIVEKMLIPVETSINLYMRQDEINNEDTNLEEVDVSFDDYYLYNTVYNQEGKTRTFFPKPFNFVENNTFDNRILTSQTKINGELIDSWAQFQENDYLDVEGIYGALTSIQEFNDNIYFFQPEGIGMLSINPRPQVVSDGVTVQLGTGNVLDDFNYITTSSGSINQFGIIKAPNGLFYIDAINYKMGLIGQSLEPVSDIKGLHSWFKTNLLFDEISQDNPYRRNGITGIYDNEKNRVLFTFLQQQVSESGPAFTDVSYTLSYNTLLGEFISFYNYKPNIYINNRNKVYSCDSNLVSLWRHGIGNIASYYNTSYEPSITLLMNPDPNFTKIFDTLLYNTKTGIVDDWDRTLEKVRIYNDYQDSGEVDVVIGSNVERKFREWRLFLPREENTMNRIRSQYAYVQLFLGTDYLELQDIILSYTPFPATYI